MMIKISIISGLFLFTIILGGQEKSCITSKCHSKLKKLKFVHAPIEDGCTNCHIKIGEHKFKIEDKNKSCIECHDEKNQGKQIHEVLSSGECIDCHAPHGGNNKAMIKTDRVDRLCFECHDEEDTTKKYVHGPNAAGNCSLCHNPHSSDHKPLLIESKEKICTRCHSDKDYSSEKIHAHSPVKQGCSSCHDPHSSNNKHQLTSTSETICRKCHEKIYKKVDAVTYKHPPVEGKQKCYYCHDVHGSSYENNLKISPLTLCLRCHDKPIIGSDGKDYNINKIVTKSLYKHGPIKDGNCSGCHDPHGSEFYKLLKKSFPKDFYTSYDPKKYESCFECHDGSLAKDKLTTTSTNFRNGNLNLHYVHVNREKGRTCRACHEIHAGNLPKHIRKETPFGKWDIPIGFEQKSDGGSCETGCHKSYTYRRDKKGQ